MFSKSKISECKEQGNTSEKDRSSLEVPCRQDWSQVFVSETGRNLKKWLAEHRQAVKRSDDKNSIAVHAHTHKHQIDWDGAKVVE